MSLKNRDNNLSNDDDFSLTVTFGRSSDNTDIVSFPTNKNERQINPFLFHGKLKPGKKFYWSEFLSEQIIKVIAFASIGIILAIFFYVFQESIYAFINQDDDFARTSNGIQTIIKDEESLKPESYSDESSSVDLKPRHYNSVNEENDLKPESYESNEATSENLQPESYLPGNNENLKQTHRDSKDVEQNDISEIEKGRDASQSLESTGQNTPVTVADLLLPNEKEGSGNEFIWQPISKVPKFSIVPLLVGALKVTLIGLLIAAPIAVLAAIFTVAFAPKWIKETVKPAIEILAGFPSVVIGFFCLMTIATVSKELFGSTFRLNAFVGGIGMSLAIIPIIYTVTEDAMSAVPKFMKEASLALGASRWQTAFRVILPAAIPGVFAAFILGFGRAFGETMIALMATGNAALISADIFEPIRTMSATIGSEMAEVEFHGVHYGVLFLIGSVLFIITFSLNALAELYIRNRLIRKFQGK